MKVRNNLPALMGKERIRSISELSRITGLPYATLQNFYHEKYNTFNGELVTKLCVLFNCEIGDLLYLDKEVS